MAVRACSASLARLAQAPIRLSTVTPLRQSNSLARAYPLACNRSFSARAAVQTKKYSKDHEWIELDSDGTTGTIGISTYAANALGDVVYVELPQADTEFASGDEIGAVESVKSASDIFIPVSGTIIEANKQLEETPGMINKSPEGDGWIAKVKVKNTAEMDELMDKDAYKKFTEAEESD